MSGLFIIDHLICLVYYLSLTLDLSGLFIFGFFLFGAVQVQAATLYMDPNHAELSRGDTLKVSVRLDTDEDECVNVVDGVITYSDNILERNQPVLPTQMQFNNPYTEDITRQGKQTRYSGKKERNQKKLAFKQLETSYTPQQPMMAQQQQPMMRRSVIFRRLLQHT